MHLKKKKTLTKEDEFCRYLCSELKAIKMDRTFRALKMEILQLVQNKINEEALSHDLSSCDFPKNVSTPSCGSSSFSQFPKRVSTSSSSSSSFSQFNKSNHTNNVFTYSPIEYSNPITIEHSNSPSIEYSTPSPIEFSNPSHLKYQTIEFNPIQSIVPRKSSPYCQSECEFEEVYYTKIPPEREQNPAKKQQIEIIEIKTMQPAPSTSKDILQLSMRGCINN